MLTEDDVSLLEKRTPVNGFTDHCVAGALAKELLFDNA